MNQKLLPALSLALWFCSSGAEAAFPPLKLVLQVESQIQSPTVICNAGDGSGRLFIAEQRGQIRIFTDGVLLPDPFLDLSALLVPERPGFDERGLLGLAFHPQYGEVAQPGTGKFYVAYSSPSPNAPGTAPDPVDCRTVLVEYQVSAGNPNSADPSTARLLLGFDKPQFNHNGGDLAFGPDGLLYMSTGDGGSSNDNNAGHTGGSSARPTNALGNSQDLTRLLGKILRIDPLGTNAPGGAYGIPAGNPFVAGTSGERPEIFAYGLRNPWKMSFDTGPGGTGQLFVADVGQGEVEEVNIITSGGNYGWRNKEGAFFPSFSVDAPPLTGTVVDPIAQYAHPGVVIGSPALPEIGISVTGGRVYRGSAIAGLAGKYVFADWSNSFGTPAGTMLGLEENAGTWTLSTLDIEGGNPIGWFIQCLGADEDGELYVGVKKTLAPSALFNGLPAGALYKLAALPAPVTTTVGAMLDTTVYSEGELSNGMGEFVFAGQTSGSALRRALLKFDLPAIPPSSQIEDAKLSLVLSRTVVGDTTMELHRLSASWGEGSSNAGTPGGAGTAATNGDATWTRSTFNTVPANAVSWSQPGGDFDPTPSASAVVGSAINTRYFWSGSKLNADLSAALADPSSHHGWILLGNENLLTSAKRFFSRENSIATNRPQLEVSYSAPDPPLTHRQQWIAQHYFVGEFVDDLSDEDEDSMVSLMEYANDEDPKAPGSAGTYFRVDDQARVHFVRDPRAVDLTYTLRGSTTLPLEMPGLVLATSATGGPATGPVTITESTFAPNPELREVTVELAGSTVQFARLEIIRN